MVFHIGAEAGCQRLLGTPRNIALGQQNLLEPVDLIGVSGGCASRTERDTIPSPVGHSATHFP
jgi:hypothetical protein